jgi:hypothetical protein
VDEVLLMDVNGDPASSNVCDADDPNHPTGTRRYFYHQDRNWNVVALTEYDDGAGTNGRLAERYAYTPYGEFIVTQGDAGSGELGRTLPASSIGNIFFHQGLAFEQEKDNYQNRHREYHVTVQRFTRRDPLAVLHNPRFATDVMTGVIAELSYVVTDYSLVAVLLNNVDGRKSTVGVSEFLYLASSPLGELDPSGLRGCCSTCSGGPRGPRPTAPCNCFTNAYQTANGGTWGTCTCFTYTWLECIWSTKTAACQNTWRCQPVSSWPPSVASLGFMWTSYVYCGGC